MKYDSLFSTELLSELRRNKAAAVRKVFSVYDDIVNVLRVLRIENPIHLSF